MTKLHIFSSHRSIECVTEVLQDSSIDYVEFGAVLIERKLREEKLRGDRTNDVIGTSKLTMIYRGYYSAVGLECCI